MPKRPREPMVIVGGGLTGGTAAKTLRKKGYRGQLLVLVDEPNLPFGRPPLSKGYLAGKEDLSSWMVRPPSWYSAQSRADPGRMIGVDPKRKKLRLESGEAIGSERLLIATGGRNRRLSVPRSGLEGVYQLRTIADCDAIKREARRGARAVVVGSGFIGSEVSASLRESGVEVACVMRGKAPLEAVLGRGVGCVRFDSPRP